MHLVFEWFEFELIAPKLLNRDTGSLVFFCLAEKLIIHFILFRMDSEDHRDRLDSRN
jgi:hypothetical protein